MIYLQLIAGFVLLLGSAEVMVRGAVQIASKLGLSRLLIGMTVVAFGTSAPEFVVSLDSTLSGLSSMALGNVVGSNIANILLILGVTSMVAPVIVKPAAIMRDGLMMLGASALFAWLSMTGEIGFMAGAVLVLALLVYFTSAYLRERKNGSASARLHEAEVDEFSDVKINIWMAGGLFVFGLVGLVYGADVLVESASTIARSFGISEAVIGLTVVAFGTSLPELATTVVAAFRKHTDVAVGNVVGSNLINILFVVGGVAMVSPLSVPDQIRQFDLWVMMAATLVMFAYLATGRQFRRLDGILFLGAYGAYIAIQVIGVENVMPRFF